MKQTVEIAIAISQESHISTFRYYYQSINVRIRIQYKKHKLRQDLSKLHSGHVLIVSVV
jgi:hypothetical protein